MLQLVPKQYIFIFEPIEYNFLIRFFEISLTFCFYDQNVSTGGKEFELILIIHTIFVSFFYICTMGIEYYNSKVHLFGVI